MIAGDREDNSINRYFAAPPPPTGEFGIQPSPYQC
jgi:hypothetical protein